MINLNREVEVKSFNVEATISVGRDKPEFLAVAQLAKDFKRPISGQDISHELLGNLPDHIGWNVIDRCVALGLLEQEKIRGRGPARLSENGESALKEGAVLVPEEGVWRFYYIDDPLVDCGIIHVERLETDDAKDERNRLYKARDNGEPKPDSGSQLPSLIRSIVDLKVFMNSLIKDKPFTIQEVARRGLPGPTWNLDLSIDWKDDEPSPEVRVLGALELEQNEQQKHSVDSVLKNPKQLTNWTYDELWTILVCKSTGLSDWSVEEWNDISGERVVPVEFDSLPPACRKTMKKDFEIPPLDIDDIGRFEATKLENVKVVPESDDDAQNWAEWLQKEEITDYCTPSILEEITGKVIGRFEYHSLELLDPHELLEQAKDNPHTAASRFILATADLGLWS